MLVKTCYSLCTLISLPPINHIRLLNHNMYFTMKRKIWGLFLLATISTDNLSIHSSTLMHYHPWGTMSNDGSTKHACCVTFLGKSQYCSIIWCIDTSHHHILLQSFCPLNYKWSIFLHHIQIQTHTSIHVHTYNLYPSILCIECPRNKCNKLKGACCGPKH
jgi:hypothetical protein